MRTELCERLGIEHPIRIDSGTVVFYLDAHHAIPRRRHDLDAT